MHFIMCDRLFPRSAIASLTVAGTCLEQLAGVRSDDWDEARGLIGLARAELEYVPPRVLVSDLHARLERLERTISLVSDLATRRYFAHDLPVEWQLETDA